MAVRQYDTFLKNGSMLNAPCNATANDSMSGEFAVQAQNLIGGYEHLTMVIIKIADSTGYVIHQWKKTYNHYMAAGSTYTFITASGFKLPAGTYFINTSWSSDGVDAGALPIVPSSDTIPMEF